jgi:dolichol-phosphate mannosyltransferase
MLAHEVVVEVIVVDDGSTDDTASVAGATGVRVLNPGSLPAGWSGKPWAVEHGVGEATGEWIVTFDADARPAVSLPQAAVDRCIADRIDFLTLAPAIDCPTWGAAWLHPSLLTTLVFRFGRPGVDAPPQRRLANGQCMVFRRDWFVESGGFGPARTASEEDVAFARLAARRGDRVAFLEAQHLLTVRAYEGFADTWRGWADRSGSPASPHHGNGASTSRCSHRRCRFRCCGCSCDALTSSTPSPSPAGSAPSSAPAAPTLDRRAHRLPVRRTGCHPSPTRSPG